MVDVKDFKEQKAIYLSVMDVMNAKDKTAIITGEATIQDFTSKSGNPFKKLIIPVSFEGKNVLLGVYADISQRIGLSLGFETKDWIGSSLTVKIAGSKSPYLTVEPTSKE